MLVKDIRVYFTGKSDVSGENVSGGECHRDYLCRSHVMVK